MVDGGTRESFQYIFLSDRTGFHWRQTRSCRGLLRRTVLASAGIVTALCSHVGYAKAAVLAKEALAKQVSVRTLVLERDILTQQELDTILNAYDMTKPGISCKELLHI